MGKSSSEIAQELDQTRADAAAKIDQLGQQVTETTESVKESLDWRYQVEHRPLLSLGVAFLGGVMLGGLTGGDDKNQSRESRSYPSRNQYSYERSETDSSQHGLSDTVKQAARASGADTAITSAVAAVATMAGQRVKDAVEEVYPGFTERYDNSKEADGGLAERMKAASSEETAKHDNANAQEPHHA